MQTESTPAPQQLVTEIANEPLQYLYVRDQTPLVQDGVNHGMISQVRRSQSFSRRNYHSTSMTNSDTNNKNYNRAAAYTV